MATRSRAVTVTSTRQQLDSTETDSTVGSSLLFTVDAGQPTVYWGGSDVTTANGMPVAAGAYSPGFDLGRSEGIWVVSASPSTIRVGETGI